MKRDLNVHKPFVYQGASYLRDVADRSLHANAGKI